MKEFVFINQEGKALCLDSKKEMYLGNLGSKELAIIPESCLEHTLSLIHEHPSLGKDEWTIKEKLTYTLQGVLEKLKKNGGDTRYALVTSQERYLNIEEGCLYWTSVDSHGDIYFDTVPFTTPFTNIEEVVLHLEILALSFGENFWAEGKKENIREKLYSGEYELREVTYNKGLRCYNLVETFPDESDDCLDEDEDENQSQEEINVLPDDDTIEIPIPEGYQLDRDKSYGKVVFRKLKP